MQNKSLTHAVLELLADFGEGTLDAFFPPQYPQAAIWRPLLGLGKSRKIKRRTISNILWRLKKQGLVERTGAKKIARWQVSAWGTNKLQREAAVRTRNLNDDGIKRLVIFDVPERERRKRDIIRAELVGCQFRQLQKSVWIGHCPLPEDFITLIDTLELSGKVHIFSVRSEGTIGEII